MTKAERIARQRGIEEAIRAASDAITDIKPVDGLVPYSSVVAIFAAMKSLIRSSEYIRLSAPVNYLQQAQRAAQAAWLEMFGDDAHGPGTPASGAVDTPMGTLECVTWRQSWSGPKRQRVAWQSKYYLNDEPVTIRTIKSAGLADTAIKRSRAPRN
jgi:hypothetical protein